MLGMPCKRMDCLKRSKDAMMRYHESQEEYWAREVVWVYRKLRAEGKTGIRQRTIRDITNMRGRDVRACAPFLGRFCSEDEAEEIGRIILTQAI